MQGRSHLFIERLATGPEACVAAPDPLTTLERLETSRRRADAEMLAALAEALRVATASEHGAAELAYRSLRAEVAAVKSMSEYQADTLLGDAFQLDTQYQATLAAMHGARISLAHSRVIIEAGMIIGSDLTDAATAARRRAYEDAVLVYAVEETPNRLRPIARKLAEQFAQVTIEERHAEAQKRAYVAVTAADDGMATLTAYLPAVDAVACYDRLTRMARKLQRDSDPECPEKRSIGEIRAALLSDLLAEGTTDEAASSGLSRVRGHVTVTVPTQRLPEAVIRDLAAQVRASRQPGFTPGPFGTRMLGGGVFVAGAVGIGPEIAPGIGATFLPQVPPILLDTFGPIPDSAGFAIAGETRTWNQLNTNPDTGVVVGVARYRPSTLQRELLAARDERCRFPGCRMLPARCDIDHTLAAAEGGPTRTDNAGGSILFQKELFASLPLQGSHFS